MSRQNDKILKQIKNEYQISLDYVINRRETFRKRLKLYNNQKKSKDLVGIVTIYTHMQTLLARYYNDKLSVSFKGRTVADNELANNINKLAEFDYDEMKMNKINFNKEWDKLFYWVGIRVQTWWDNDKKCPIVSSQSPADWFPDPAGDFENDFSFHWFEKQIRLSKLKSLGGYTDLDKVTSWLSEEQQKNNSASWSADGTNKSGATTEDIDIVTILHWFTIIDWEKYLITTANANSLIIRKEKIKKISKNEKDSDISFPIALSWYSPQRNNPFGTSVPDLTEDKQRAISVISNLRIQKEKASLYWMYLYDETRIPNKSDLDFGLNKAIGVKWPVDPSIFQPMQKDLNRGTSFNVEDAIDREAQLSTWAGATQQGALTEDARTLGEQQMVQSSADLKFGLGSEVNAWGERDFWEQWYRAYKVHFKAGMKKIIRIHTWFGVKPIEFTRDDFFTQEDPDIDIESKFKSEKEREKQRLMMTSIYPIIIQDQTLAEISKTYLKKEFLRVNWLDEDKISIIYPKSPQETIAENENELLKRNEEAIAQQDEDHLTHDFIHSQIEQTPSALVHRQQHRDMYLVQVEQQKQMELQAQQNMVNEGKQPETEGSEWNVENMATIAQAQSSNQLSNLNAKQ